MTPPTKHWLATAFVALGTVAVSLGAQAQQLPVPGAPHPDWVLREVPARHGMPTKRVYAAPQPGRLPAVEQRNAETGAVTRFSDPAHGLVYDLENRIIEDQRDGKRYIFYRKGAPPKVPRREITYL